MTKRKVFFLTHHNLGNARGFGAWTQQLPEYYRNESTAITVAKSIKCEANEEIIVESMLLRN